MSDSLQDRLTGLGAVPLPPLAGAAAARARGARRTARTRAALAGAGAVVAVLAVTAGAALSGAQPDRLTERVSPPAATSGPPATPSPAPTASPEVLGSVRPLRPGAVLDADAVAAAVGGRWSPALPVEPAPYPVLLVCAAGSPAEEGFVASVSGDGDALVVSQVLGYADAAAAARAVDAVTQEVRRCPSRPEDSQDGRATVSSALLSGATTDRVIVEQRSRDCADCRESVRSYELRQVADAVVLVSADDAGLLAPLVDAAVTRLQDEVEPAAPLRPDVFPQAFLTPEQAAAAESPEWEVLADRAPAVEPLLDPCDDGTEPFADRVRETGERTMRSQREAGGSTLEQEVHVYDHEGAASDALAAHADRVRRCPTGRVRQGPADHSVERTVLPYADDRFLVRERYCGPQCSDLSTSYVLVARAGSLVTTARYLVAEDGDPFEHTERLLDAVAARLAGAAP